MPPIDFEIGSGSASSGGGDEMGVDQELEAGEAAAGLLCMPLSFRAWVWL